MKWKQQSFIITSSMSPFNSPMKPEPAVAPNQPTDVCHAERESWNCQRNKQKQAGQGTLMAATDLLLHLLNKEKWIAFQLGLLESSCLPLSSHLFISLSLSPKSSCCSLQVTSSFTAFLFFWLLRHQQIQGLTQATCHRQQLCSAAPSLAL